MRPTLYPVLFSLHIVCYESRNLALDLIAFASVLFPRADKVALFGLQALSDIVLRERGEEMVLFTIGLLPGSNTLEWDHGSLSLLLFYRSSITV